MMEVGDTVCESAIYTTTKYRATVDTDTNGIHNVTQVHGHTSTVCTDC